MDARHSDSSGTAAATASGPGPLIRDANFRRLWLTGFAAGSMRWLETLAVSVYVFEVTGSPLIVALMMVARMAPMLLGAAIGALADRFDRKTILLAGLGTMSVSSATLGTLALLDSLALWQIAVGAFLNGVFFASEFPVRRNMLGETAGVARVGAALTLDSATNNATRMLGPTLGGFLVGTVGLYGAFFMAAAVYALAFGLVRGFRYARATPVSGGGLLTSLAEGVRAARSDRRIVGVLAVTVLVNLFGFPFSSMIPVIGKDVLALGPLAVGILMSAEGFGSFTGALILTVTARRRHYPRIYLYGSMLFAAAILAFSLSPKFGVSLTLIVAAGAGVAGFTAMQGTLVFSAAPSAIRARVMGVLSMCIGAGPLGVLHVGLMAAWFGAPAALTIIGVEGLLALVVAAFVWPELRRPVNREWTGN